MSRHQRAIDKKAEIISTHDASMLYHFDGTASILFTAHGYFITKLVKITTAYRHTGSRTI